MPFAACAFESGVDAWLDAVEAALADAATDGVLLLVPSRHAGADREELLQAGDAGALFSQRMRLHRRMRAIETSGKPVAAVLCGSAVGIGFELALMAHHRVVVDDPAVRLGIDDVSFGLVPGAGATQRLPRAIGIAASLRVLLEGHTLRARDAVEAGAAHAIAAPGEATAAANAWLERVREGLAFAQPWDAKGSKVPGGAVQSPAMQQYFTAANAMLRERTFGNYPAAVDTLSCVYEGLQTDIDTGLKIEARYFAHAALTPAAKNVLRLLEVGVRDANRIAGRPPHVAPAVLQKVGVIGAGMMGSGIAAATARAGIDVVLIDTTQEVAESAKARVADGTQRERIVATTDFERLEGATLVIETVYEDRDVKAAVTSRAESILSPDAVVASNTSTLPIDGLASALKRPERFVGLHFFSPADRMPLVEIIAGRRTADDALALAMDYVRAIGKTPIVVSDSRGFYTSRVFATYITEGLAMLGTGVAPALIDNAGRIAGMPVGPLALTDEVSVELVYRINRQTRADLGSAFVQPDAERVAVAMVERFERLGKKTGRGFYDYTAGGKRLWVGLREAFERAAEQPSVDGVVERLIAIQSVEAARCLEERIVARAIDADVGALLGWGYPAFRGGPLGWIDTLGVARFVSDAKRLAERYGPRFSPPELLLEMAARGRRFYT